MSKISADNISSRSGGNISISNNLSISGFVTATTISATTISATTISATTISATTYENIPPSSDWRDNSLF